MRSEDVKLFSSCCSKQAIVVVGKLGRSINISALRVIGHVDVLPKLSSNALMGLLRNSLQLDSVVIVGSSEELFASMTSDYSLFTYLSLLMNRGKGLMIIAFNDGGVAFKISIVRG